MDQSTQHKHAARQRTKDSGVASTQGDTLWRVACIPRKLVDGLISRVIESAIRLFRIELI
jgi:hypothetical protein